MSGGTVVVGYDRDAAGRDALALGELLARDGEDGLLVAHVAATPEGEEEVAEEVAALLGASGVPFECRTIAARSVARALHELLEGQPGAGPIALGSTHRASVGRVMPGGVAGRLLHGAPCGVAVAPRGFAAVPEAPRSERPAALSPAEGLRVIGVGLDGSPESELALEAATRIGLAARATLRVIAVHGPSIGTSGAGAGVAEPSPGADLETRLHDAVAALPGELRALPISERGTPAAVLLERAEEGIDLMVVGSRGYGPLRAVLLGSVSTALVTTAPCPVLITPRSASAPP